MKQIKKVELETAKTLFSMYQKSNDQKDYKIFLEYFNSVNTRISFDTQIKEYLRSRSMTDLAREMIEYCVKNELTLDQVIDSLKMLGIYIED